MLKAVVSSPQVSVLEQGLNAASLRHKVVSNNIANVNTPGFKKSEVLFEDILQEQLNGGGRLAMTRTNGSHIAGVSGQVAEPSVSTINSTSFRADGNNVDVDTEMANLAKNNIYYNALVTQLSKHFSIIKSAINGGRS